MTRKGLFIVFALVITYVIADYSDDEHYDEHDDDHEYDEEYYEDDDYYGEESYADHGPSQKGSRYGNRAYRRGYGSGGYAGFDGPQRGVKYGPGYSGIRKNGPGYGYKGSSQFYRDGVFGGKGPYIAGGNFGLGRGGIKSALAPIANAALHGNFNPLGNYGYGGYGGLQNYAGKEINRYRLRKGLHALNPDDLDYDGEDDHLTATKHKIDDYLAKQWLMGKRKLTVSVDYGNMPLEYQYLGQYHGFPNPIAGTPLGKVFGLPYKSANNKVPVKTGGYKKPLNKGYNNYGNNYGNKFGGNRFGGNRGGHRGQSGGHGGHTGGQGGHGGHNPQFRQGGQQGVHNQQREQAQQQGGGTSGLQPLNGNYVPPKSQQDDYVPPKN